MDTTANVPHATTAPHVITCRACGHTWPCKEDSGRIDEHEPNPIPAGAILITSEHVTTLIEWTIGANIAVVLDRYATPWFLFSNEDGDPYALTVECPDDNLPPYYDVDALPVDRGPLLLLFNGDLDALPAAGMPKAAVVKSFS